MEMKHFSHDHVLMLRKDQTEDGEPVVCYACEQRIHGLSYSCRDCLYFLHRLCAQLPLELSHPSHPQHILSLRPTAPTYYRGFSYCDICRGECYRFVYHCESCSFDLDIKCTSMAANIGRRIEHNCHQHELTPIEKAAIFLCDGCGAKHKDTTSYMCYTCGFWVSQECANSLPGSVQLHNHSCNLLYSFPWEIWGLSDLSCNLCENKVNKGLWNYGCFQEGFEYKVHVNCALPMIEHSRDGIIAVDLQDLGLNLTDIIANSTDTPSSREDAEGGVQYHLPRRDETVYIFTKFIKYISLTQGKHTRWNSVIKHDQHPHVLHFSDKLGTEHHPLCEVCKQSLSADDPLYHCSQVGCSFFLHVQCALLPDELHHPSRPEHLLSLTTLQTSTTDAFCGGCKVPISGTASVYLCTRTGCNFYLHEWCALLPDKIQHPSHPEHSLCLITTTFESVKKNIYYMCQCCKQFADIFVYACLECKFHLDCKCACLPRTIRHEAHKHPLALRNAGRATCSACGNLHCKIHYVCDICKISFCTQCAVLPGITWHRYDQMHPFVLTYAPIIREFPDEGFCELCVEEIRPDEWFYHCTKCDQSLHTKCRFPTDLFSNVVSSIGINSRHHPHLLYAHETAHKPFPCGICHKLVLRHSNAALHCKPCNYWLHVECYLNSFFI